MSTTENAGGNQLSRRFGQLIRARRKALGLNLADLAISAGVGIRFVHDLERGKPTCQIGRALSVASLVGLDPVALLEETVESERP
jgi:y4mF family transcriptional regulator